MSIRSLGSLFCLLVFAIAPLAGCTPPASEDVHGSYSYVSSTGSAGCCPMITAEPGTTVAFGLPIEIDVSPITTAAQ